jgi:beta-glucanase (GH16 family)
MAARLLFNDEFDNFDAYSKADAWRTAYHWGASTAINGEKGYYVDTENAGTTGPAGAVNPFTVSNGVLTITSAPAAGLPTGQPYTSGVISSMGNFERQYGYYEMRADMPGGQGFWPAFWLMPVDKVSPPELDIMEFSSRRANEYVTTSHSTAGGSYQMSQEFTYGLPNLSEGFHTYAVDWQADKVTWYFDDRAVHSITTPADFHKPMYMLLNQAVGGGSWIGAPDGSTQQFNIDYVRVYDSRTGDAATPPPVPPPPTTSTGGSTTIVAPNLDGDDALAGGDGDDSLRGDLGNDTIRAGVGNDQVFGGNGNDVLYGNVGSDSLYGGTGSDMMFGGLDNDAVYGGQGSDLVSGDLGNDLLSGDDGNDMVSGGDGLDTCSGGAGDDSVNGNAGNDLINGNLGNDVLHGGQGNDTAHGGQNDDQIWGNLGDDELWGDMGNDTLVGGAGADRFCFGTGSGRDVIADFGGGSDRIVLAARQTYTLGASDAGDAVITFTQDDQVTLLGVRPSQVTADLFVSG